MSADRITAAWGGHYQDLWDLSAGLRTIPKRVLDALWIHHGTGVLPASDPAAVVGLIMLRVRAEFRGAERRYREAGSFDRTSFACYAEQVQSIHDRWSLRIRSLADIAACA